MGKPFDLVQAEIIEAICRRYGCLPSQAVKEDAGILRHWALLALGDAT